MGDPCVGGARACPGRRVLALAALRLLPLDRVAIYRNLLSLTAAGLLVTTQLGDNVWRFELPHTSSSEHGAPPHFVCNDCGDVACLPDSAVTLRGEATRNKVAEVQLRGRCVTCVRA